ncbi:MAG: alpha/beta fold hydrolase [Bdellovibrionaceae bacterium]|jgi:pimeloyl-ACP methyl ester carboxylesterase|nr:alpha/beta fold hydrolase [Pseudobdellovibrionaceae bacterium]
MKRKNKVKLLYNRYLYFSLGLFLALGTFYLYPIESFSFIKRQRMSFVGATSSFAGSFHYYELGDCQNKQCQCTLLIHGLGDYALTWSQMFYEAESKDLFNKKIFAINLPGSGKSKTLNRPEDYSAKKIAQDISFHFLSLCQQWTVYGNSLGGWIGFYVAQDTRVNKLILENSAGVSGDYGYVSTLFNEISVKNIRTLKEKTYHKQIYLPDFIFEAMRLRLTRMPIRELLEAQQSLDFLDKELEGFKKETLIIWGLSDKLLSPDMGKKFHNLLPNSQWLPIKNCGHLPHKECLNKIKPYL